MEDRIEKVNEHLKEGERILQGIIDDIKEPVDRDQLEENRRQLADLLKALREREKARKAARDKLRKSPKRP